MSFQTHLAAYTKATIGPDAEILADSSYGLTTWSVRVEPSAFPTPIGCTYAEEPVEDKASFLREQVRDLAARLA